MKERMEACDYPEEPIDGPNIWRVKGGDRVVWVGLSRSEQTSVDGVLGIVDCRAAVAVLGDDPDSPFPFMNFEQSPEAVALCTAGLQAERSLGFLGDGREAQFRQAPPFKLDHFLCVAVCSANEVFNDVYKPLLKKIQQTYPQYVVMVLLWERDGRTDGELGGD